MAFFRKHWFPVAFIIIVALLVLAYAAGVRVGPGLSLTFAETLTVTDLPENAQVVIDQNRVETATGGQVMIRVAPGAHTVFVEAEGYKAWDELFVMEKGESVTLRPILIPSESVKYGLTEEEEAGAPGMLEAYVLPTSEAPLLLSGGCIEVYASENRVLARASAKGGCEIPTYLCEKESCSPTIVYPAADSIRSVFPAPGREDALVVSARNAVYVAELDPREPRLFTPLYRGDRPTALPYDKDFILVAEAGNYFKLPL